MNDMDKDTVDWVPNYDETRQEPTVFPSAFPNLLINGGTGTCRQREDPKDQR